MEKLKQSKFIDFYAGKSLVWGLVGVAGSGKTVLSIIYIIQNIHKFQILATNIKGFKPELVKQATGADFEYIQLGDEHGKIKKEDIVKHLNYLNEINKDLPEDERVASLNILDESHQVLRFLTSKNQDEIEALKDFAFKNFKQESILLQDSNGRAILVYNDGKNEDIGRLRQVNPKLVDTLDSYTVLNGVLYTTEEI